MVKKRSTLDQRRPAPSARIPMAAVRRYVRQIAERFQPEKIILFGSYDYGTPHADSDVDLLIVMEAANEINQAVRIRRAVDAPFPLDLLVRTPARLERRLKDGNWFLREIVEKGKVLYAQGNRPLGAQSRSRSARGAPAGRRVPTPQ
jgi:predicted nucleotidyltransferase